MIQKNVILPFGNFFDDRVAKLDILIEKGATLDHMISLELDDWLDRKVDAAFGALGDWDKHVYLQLHYGEASEELQKCRKTQRAMQNILDEKAIEEEQSHSAEEIHKNNLKTSSKKSWWKFW